MPDLSIIIVNHNNGKYIEDCLKSFIDENFPINLDVVVVDNNSRDGSLEFLRREENKGKIKLIINKKNLGFGKANNIGVKATKGKIIMLMNPDIKSSKKAIIKTYDYLKENPQIGILAPKLVFENGQLDSNRRKHIVFSNLIIKRTFLKRIPSFKSKLDKYLMKNINPNRVCEVDLLTGACMLIRRSVFDKVNGFDESFFLFMEDFDLCNRVRKLGLKIIYYPESCMIHRPKRLSGNDFIRSIFKKTFYIHLISTIKYLYKWRSL